ncbi:hypothetical protein [Vibrio sp. HN007]|uniref:hypothetical protein n=1 Tax=Vibrio iocasae TaxID=3098914 RepID=UPI0035D4E2AA
MNPAAISELSLLRSALSSGYSIYLESVIDTVVTENNRRTLMNIYASYCYLMEQGSYSGLDILNNSKMFNQHFRLYTGFIYSNDRLTMKTKYSYCHSLKNIFKRIAQDKQLTFDNIKLSHSKISEDASNCIEQFCEIRVDQTKAKYLNGWSVESKEGKKLEVHLDAIYVAFGESFTDIIHSAIKDYAFKHKVSTLKHNISHLKNLFIGMVSIYTKRNGFTIETYLSRNHAQAFFHKIYKINLARSQASLRCPKSFHEKWKALISVYRECFIDTGIFDEPLKPFIIPEWKEPAGKAPTFSVGGEPKKEETLRWFANIPLKIKDQEAIEIITQRLDRDMSHIKHVCQLKFKELIERDVRNQEYMKIGSVKPVNAKSNYAYFGFCGVGELENTIATFFHYGIKGKADYTRYLGFKSNTQQLIKELNLPTKSTLHVLLTLLIIEHPLITPSWIDKWYLFDENGNQTGYKEMNGQYVAVSYKSRKGASNAQQTVILNEFSKSVVEFLIQHTQMARDYLKNQGKKGWRKMMLTATVNDVLPVHIIHNSKIHNAEFSDWLRDPKLMDENLNITLLDAIEIAEIYSLRSVRRHRGLQIYLETQSMDAVAEGLGHKRKDPKILASYLPKPLMDFFNARWVRQFQNAILLEALKDSKYLLQAVIMSTKDIQEFLEHHGLSGIPEHFNHGFGKQATGRNNADLAFNEIAYTISTSLLQLLIAIRFIVENSDDEVIFLDIVSHWYQSAVFVIDSLTTSGNYRGDAELMDMYEIASNNKIDTNLIIGALLC